MLLVDVHAHLDLEGYEQYGGIDALIDECEHNGVKIIVANGVNIDSNRRIFDIAKKHPIVKIALGIYPMHCLELIESNDIEKFEEELKFIEHNIKSKSCVAIGEVGLDYKNFSNLENNRKNIQKDCLKKFITIAKKYNIPIIVHSRDAELETVELLENESMKNKKVIMHCFSGRKHVVARIKNNGWYFSIPCNIERSLHFQQIVRDIPVEQLLTETDAPLLSPIPGTINRFDNVKITIKKIAELKHMTPEEVSNIIYANYIKLFC